MTQTETPAVRQPPLVVVEAPGRGDAETVVWLGGEHDLGTAQSLSAAIASAIAGHDADLTVDLRGVQFMDTTTVVVILLAKSSMEADGRRLTVRNPSRFARLVLGACELDHLVEPELVVHGTSSEPRRPAAPTAAAEPELGAAPPRFRLHARRRPGRGAGSRGRRHHRHPPATGRT